MMQTLQRLQTRLLLGAQADVIEHFLECEHNLSAKKVENWKQLLTTLREVNVCFHDIDAIENRIQSPELTEAEGLELLSYLVQHRKQLHEFYAPSQRMITDHIKKICGL